MKKTLVIAVLIVIAATFVVLSKVDVELFPEYRASANQPLFVVGTETDPPNTAPGEKFTQTLPDGQTIEVESRIVGYRIGTKDGKILFVVQPFGAIQQ